MIHFTSTQMLSGGEIIRKCVLGTYIFYKPKGLNYIGVISSLYLLLDFTYWVIYFSDLSVSICSRTAKNRERRGTQRNELEVLYSASPVMQINLGMPI